MAKKYSYPWYINQFEKTKDKAEKFLLSVDENKFVQPPAEGKWSIAECYSHLIEYGNLYYNDMAQCIADSQDTSANTEQTFQPRWIFQKIISFFEPPYKIKLKTVNAMKPEPVSNYNRMELLDEFVNLQDRFIAQLEKGQHSHINLNTEKIDHPILPVVKMTLSECFALAEVHQRRHQWQAEQTLEALNVQK